MASRTGTLAILAISASWAYFISLLLLLQNRGLTTFSIVDSFGTRGNSGADRFGKYSVSKRKASKTNKKDQKKFL